MGSGSHSLKRKADKKKKKKKRSQKHSKIRSKSSREKAKMANRLDDSYSEEDLSSTSLSSYSSSEDDYRSKRRDRSLDRTDSKARKKQPKRSGLASERSEDSLSIKKRKRPKRSRGSDSRKKRRGKKHRRERSVSSSSDRSRSCSTREYSDDSGKEFERKGEKSVTKERKLRERGKEKSRRYRSRHRSMSCSPCSIHSESYSNQSEVRVTEENNPKRLKSVIIAVREGEEVVVRESNRDWHKDEIVYKHGDYPSRSNDSDDGASRGELLSCQENACYEKTTSLEDPNIKAVASDAMASDISGVAPISVDKTSEVTLGFVGSGVDDHLKESKPDASAPDSGSKRDDLEATVRQKALENLLKRRSQLSTKILSAGEEPNLNGEEKKSSTQQAKPAQSMLDEEGNSRFVQKLGKVDGEYKTTATRAQEDSDVRPPSSRAKLSLSTSKKEPLGVNNTWRRESTSQEASQSNLSMPKETVAEDSTKGSEFPSSDVKRTIEKVDSLAASEPSTVGGQSSNDKTNEGDKDSQFQQKKMSVMRGGEMVEVSYKVYIPKKAPALARRQLKR